MIVVDANVILYCFSETLLTPTARDVRGRDPGWIAPALWRFEVLNALSVLVRSGTASPAEASRIFSRAYEVMRRHERDVDGDRVLALANRLGITGYDAAYVELALNFGVDLVTEDRALLRSAAPPARSMADFLRPPGTPQVREASATYSTSHRTPARRPRKRSL